MNLNEAKQLLKKSGYIVLKESNNKEITITPAKIFQILYSKAYKYWADSDVSASDLQGAFDRGFKNDIDWESYREYLINEYDNEKDLDYLKSAFNDGRIFGRCTTDMQIEAELSDRLDF